MTGFFYEIITEALGRRMDLPIQWEQMPWKRCQEQVRSGRSDAMITVPTSERRMYCRTHADPFYLKKMKLFTYAGHLQMERIKTITAIADIKRMGYTVITYSGNGWHKKNITGLGIPSFETSEVHNVWKMLAAKRGDLVIEWPLGAGAGIKKAGIAHGIVETDIALESMPFHLLVGEKSGYTCILNRFNLTIKKMAGDGTMTRILSGYGINAF